MRIIGGLLGGRKLSAPAGGLARPTTGRVREAIFNLVEARMQLVDSDVLDLFAGTGSLALEALSRGAAKATLVEKNGYILRYAHDNCRSVGRSDQCKIRRTDAMEFLSRSQPACFDLILADPPYRMPNLSDLPDPAIRLLRPPGLFVLEHDMTTRMDDHPALITSRAYGRTRVSLFGS
ncbi:MAG: 16S rRNA (guanine(966)-N(2))-methyltransferase RsmD [Bacteroidota bacterium]|nr:16S rRNA (guanine(966)-N(2))-methyltransferase RsmD [Bacteroidota bacterium]